MLLYCEGTRVKLVQSSNHTNQLSVAFLMAADRKTELAVLLSNLYCSDFATGFIGVAT